MSFTIENLEYFFLIIARVSGFIFTAPFFSNNNIPRRIKVAITVFLSIIIAEIIGVESVEYQTTVEYTILIIKEIILGLILGYFTNICTYILSFAGQFIDTEIGFAMARELDPATQMQVTVTSNLLSYIVMLMMMVTYVHHYIIKAFVDVFKLVPIGMVHISSDMYKVMLKFIVDYFIIALRIALPIFACILTINIVLGILARVAPQMNMFVIGMQIKVFIGLFILFLISGLIPSISDFIFGEMKVIFNEVLRYVNLV